LWHKDVEASVDHVEERAGNIEGSVSSHRTIFEELLRSPELPKEDKQRPRLIQEGAALIGAGGETTSQVLAIIVWGLLDDDTKRTTLQKELKNLGGHTKSHDNLSLRKLESLPYLVRLVPRMCMLNLADYETDRLHQRRLALADRKDRAAAACACGSLYFLQRH
jgi:hypothetical protein